ncbi:unnamed protein product [Miscanthus lutarioriparius]|uniref:Uncharacterized protein n=1 Tax=Miscanthus lutarioriparius TaxID=422564 RepID=A0A811RPX8_9POAL|nr:unnamed protein product [Miscanthus lutarioriparius]
MPARSLARLTCLSIASTPAHAAPRPASTQPRCSLLNAVAAQPTRCLHAVAATRSTCEVSSPSSRSCTTTKRPPTRCMHGDDRSGWEDTGSARIWAGFAPPEPTSAAHTGALWERGRGEERPAATILALRRTPASSSGGGQGRREGGSRPAAEKRRRPSRPLEESDAGACYYSVEDTDGSRPGRLYLPHLRDYLLTRPHDRPFPRSCKPWLVASSPQGWQSTLHPWTLGLYNCTLQFVPFCYFSEEMEHATQFWAPSLLPSLSLAANSGEHTQARNHHSTKRGHFCHAAMHGSILEIF